MSDDSNDPITPRPSPGALLDELGSLKALLDEESQGVVPYNSVNEISSVEDYLRLKQQADTSGVSIEAYLQQQAAPALHDDEEEAIPLLDESCISEEETSDSLLLQLAEEPVQGHTLSTTEATSVEEYFRAVAAAKRPHQAVAARAARPAELTTAPPHAPDAQRTADEAIPGLEEVVAAQETIPVLDEVATPSAAEPRRDLSLVELQDLVEFIVERQVQRLKPELEREVMAELQKLLPLSGLTNS